MTASVETWKSYAHLLARLSPRVSHILFASRDGILWWSSDPPDASRMQYALSLLLRPPTSRNSEVDGLIETEDRAESRYGFRIRGALGEVLGLLVIALPQPEAALDLGAVHALIKPALDCLQRELSARAAIGELHESSADSSSLELNLFQGLSESSLGARHGRRWHASVKHRTGSSFTAQVSGALASDALELLAQPILPLSAAPADPRFEILLRMRATDGTRLGLEKLVGPTICKDLRRGIDRWVIEQTIERLADCRSQLRDYPAKFSVNLSEASLADGQFWRMLEELVRESRIEPGTLSFEFPEEAASSHFGTLAPFMCRLREQGINFALDNFGRGVGSLAHLNLLPVSCIKIDGSFSRDLIDNPRSQSMVVAITKLAHSFGMETVAGYIETDAIRARAAQLGVDYGQGFFIGKPLALDDAIHDLPLYSCFATSTGVFERSLVKAAAPGG